MRSRDEKLADLEQRVADACGVLNVANASLVRLTGELIETELWRGYGIRAIEHWLTLKAGLSPERARQLVEVAGAAEALPVTTQRLADGELSFEQVHAVARHPGKFRDEEAASFASIATVPQIRRSLSRYTFDTGTNEADADVAAADLEPAAQDVGADSPGPAAAAAAGRLSRFSDGNRFALHVDAPVDQGGLIEAALSEAKNALFDATGDSPTPPTSRVCAPITTTRTTVASSC